MSPASARRGVAAGQAVALLAIAMATRASAADRLSESVDEAMSEAGVVGQALVCLKQGKVAARHGSGMANDPAASRYQSSIGQAVNTMLALMLVALPFWLGSRRGWRRGLAAWMGGAAIVSLLAAIGVLGNTRAERELPAEWIAARLSTTATVMGRLSAELLSPSLLAATGSRLLLQTEASVSDCIGRSLIMGTDRCGGQATAWQWGANLGFQSLTVLAPESGSAVVMLTNTGGGIDAMVPGRGGYPAAKRIAARLLGIEGRWDLRP